MIKKFANSLSPAYVAVALLFGLLFLFAVVGFGGMGWQSWMTSVFYLTLLLAVTSVVASNPKGLFPLTRLDWFAAGFILLIPLSFILHHPSHEWMRGYLRYFPFFVVLPLLCGKMMQLADIARFSRVVVYAGLAIFPLLLLDRVTSAPQLGTRWTFFGQNHSPLLVGALLATALLAQGVRRATSQREGKKAWLPQYGLMALFTVVLVWVSARGWLLTAVAALLIMSVIAYRNRKLCIEYARQFALVLIVATLSITFLPHQSGQFYAGLLTPPSHIAETGGERTGDIAILGSPQKPILGDESCRTIIDGANSVAIRWTLYREAWEIFRLSPLIGVGAGNFGLYSCSGIMGFPHSTVLQSFSELGLLGGFLLLTIVALMIKECVCDMSEPGTSEVTSARQLVIALFAAYFLADQIYGNYFLSSGTYLLIGMYASLHKTQES